jgi:hypothetical protein
VILKALVCSVALSRLTLKLNDLFVILIPDELLSGSKNDCADAGRANAASRNNSEKQETANDRVDDFDRNIGRFSLKQIRSKTPETSQKN